MHICWYTNVAFGMLQNLVKVVSLYKSKYDQIKVNRPEYVINVLYLLGLLVWRCGCLPGVNKIRVIYHKFMSNVND